MIREPFTKADLRDLERAHAAIDRIAKRHGVAYEDYDFDPINQVRAAAQLAIREVTGE